MRADARGLLLLAASIVAIAACTSQLAPDFALDGPVRLLDPGSGRDGDLEVVAGTRVVVNECRAIVRTEGAALVLTSAGAFADGDRVLVWQVQDAFATSGTSASASLSPRAGTWEVLEARGADGTLLALATSPYHVYESTSSGLRAQVCRVPQYRNVTIAVGGTVEALAWSEAGGAGGVVAMFVSGILTVDGAVSADGAGFEGGPGFMSADDMQDFGLVETTNADLAASKGGGVDGRGRSRRGRGNFANGGGGGNANDGGGGGGGARGAGGNGGTQNTTYGDFAFSGGIGGAAIDVAIFDRLVMGGGGGAGHQDNGSIEHGASGGGVVLLIASGVEGSGEIRANGADGDPASRLSNDGGPGGGGGGAIVLVSESAAGSTFGGTLRARGGRGGDVSGDDTFIRGPGGGGGGGSVYVRGLAAAIDVEGGAAGVNVHNQSPHGAGPGSNGDVVVE